MAFKSPTISLPTALKPGWIYFIREEDYLDRSVGRYVKIGLTARTVAIRIAEHQTGNPRREFEATPSNYIELMDYGETYLHHYFAAERIGGEWFDFDDPFLASDVRPVIDNLETEMAAVAGSFRRWKELNNIPSNGTVRTATPTEAGWGVDFTAAYEQLTVAKAILDTHKNNLKNLLGNNKAIDTIMHIQQKTKNPTFNQTVFEGILTAAQLLQCNSPTTSWSRSLNMLNKGQDLATLDPTVKLAFDASEIGLNSPSATNMAGATLPLTQAIQDENSAMLNAMRDVKVQEWECLKAQAKLVEALDDSLEIDGILKWKREQTTASKFDRKLAKSVFETEFNASFRPPTTPYTYSTEFDYNRKYNP
ncbi:hypothetical protein N9Y01_02120 [Candidatus Poseidonia alphae]|nr:hypothetical protein [Candidatus Poseidonia alphae]